MLGALAFCHLMTTIAPKFHNYQYILWHVRSFSLDRRRMWEGEKEGKVNAENTN